MATMNFWFMTTFVFACIVANVLVLFLTDWSHELNYWEARFELEVKELPVYSDTVPTDLPPGPRKSFHSKPVINPYSFKFISESDGCKSVHPPKGAVFLLILVACRPREIKDRILIRKTWGEVKEYNGKSIMVRFLIAQPKKVLERSLIDEEIDEFGDIIQGDFDESYKNMTLKVLMGLKWAGLMCPDATYVMNMDCDMFINVYNLVTLLEYSPRKRFAIGHLRENAKPFRKNDTKWQTPLEMYPESTYPPYLNGPAYVMSGDLPGLIFNESSHLQYLPWDDVFIGIVMKRIGVTPLSGNHFEDYPQLNITSKVLSAISKGIATHVSHQKKPNQILSQIWKNISKSIVQ